MMEANDRWFGEPAGKEEPRLTSLDAGQEGALEPEILLPEILWQVVTTNEKASRCGHSKPRYDFPSYRRAGMRFNRGRRPEI